MVLEQVLRAYAFDQDSDTGMFRSGVNTIGFSTAGTTRVLISDSGLDMSNGLPIRFQDSSGSPFVALKSPSSIRKCYFHFAFDYC